MVDQVAVVPADDRRGVATSAASRAQAIPEHGRPAARSRIAHDSSANRRHPRWSRKEQLCRLDLQGISELVDEYQRDVLLPALDGANVGAMNKRGLGKLLLG